MKIMGTVVGSILLLLIVLGVAYVYITGGVNSETVSDLNLQTEYLKKNDESYARCYNSVNYGASLLGNVRLRVLSENFNNISITSARLDAIQEKFMSGVKAKCQKSINDYELAYKKATTDQHEINSAQNAFLDYFFGSARGLPSMDDLSSYAPASARIRLAFNDCIFTEKDAKEYFETELGI